MVREADELFQPIAEDKDLQLVCTVPENYHIEGDVRMIQRMIANLLDNAIKYTPQGGSVRIAVHPDAEKNVVVSVRDSGIGIHAKDLDHIFERFYRCDQSRSEAGIGLGLSLAKTIARAHGGDITAVSNPGTGSTFTVFLPQTGTNRKVN